MNSYDLSKREYPSIGYTIDDLKKQYLNNIIKYEPQKKIVSDKHKNSIRLMSYNVHFWTDVHEKDNLIKICNTILELQPDIVCLQEVLASTIYTSKHNLLDEYEILSFCNVTPSWFNDVYGNMILINKLFKLKIKKSTYSEYYKMNICGKTNKCTLSQFNNTYKSLKCCSKHTPDKLTLDSSDETRCFIKISLPTFDIICTHLEAYNTDKRILQLKELNEYITRETYILGDFNMINEAIYPKKFRDEYIDKPEYDRYKNVALGYDTITRFTDNIWENISLSKPDFSLDFTTWNGTAVDYIFRVIPKKQQVMISKLNVLFTHLLKTKTSLGSFTKLDFGKLLFNNNSENINLINTFLNKYDTELNILSPYFSGMKLDPSENYYNKLKDAIKKCIYFFTGSKTIDDARKKTKDVSFINSARIRFEAYELDEYFEIIRDNLQNIFKNLNINNVVKFGIYPSDSSDHMPLFVDIENEPITSTAPYIKGLEDIEKNLDYTKNKYIELSVDDFIKKWNEINKVSFDTTNFTIYNGQPGLVHNWINFDSSISREYDFKDPYNFGTSKGSNSLGNIGIYGADTYDKAFEWGYSFSLKYLQDHPTASDEKKVLALMNIIFELKLNFDTDIKIIYIDNELEWMNYNDQFDKVYDIIVGEGFTEIKITTKNFKQSSRKNKYLTLEKKYGIENINNILKKIYSIKNTNNTLKKIYNFNNISLNKYELSLKPGPVVPVVPVIPGGGNNNQYKLKYLKYKQKYLELKKNME